jgi:hypothetical protein
VTRRSPHPHSYFALKKSSGPQVRPPDPAATTPPTIARKAAKEIINDVLGGVGSRRDRAGARRWGAWARRGLGSVGPDLQGGRAAHLAVESLHGEGRIPSVGATELRELLDDAAQPLQTVLDAVLATRTQRDQDVLTAFAERDSALETAAADRGARDRAERDAALAEAAVAEAHHQVRDAEDLCAAAVRARAAARARDPGRAQMRAEGQGAALEELAGPARRSELVQPARHHRPTSARIQRELSFRNARSASRSSVAAASI